MYQQHIVIVGAGIVGLATAYALLKQGMQHVTVLEQATVDHCKSTSHGLSRLLRFEYGNNQFYSEMVQLSLKRWKNLELVSRRTLYTRTGLLTLGNEDDNFTLPSYHSLLELGLSPERLSRRYCAQHFPQFKIDQHNLFTYNREAGLLHASLCLHTLKELILELGGKIFEAARITSFSHESPLRPIRLHLADGDEMQADRLVLATGPWVHHLLDDLHLPIRLTRQYLLYFSNLPASSFALHKFPAFLVDDLYGFPLHNTCVGNGPCWLKATSHEFGTLVDPDAAPVVDSEIISRIVDRLCKLLPALERADLARVEACIYDVSPDEDFILDRLPYDSRIVFATGLSGHGFKFGLLLGEILSSMVHDTAPPVATEQFSLARLAHTWHTQATSVA
ncbi:MAG: FAD-dependent oxidoreductase [Ktedonobacteraceae bacterium]|nr:FAD-dependent oxidoreductase [Ktedonobacteraceae bacterium]